MSYSLRAKEQSIAMETKKDDILSLVKDSWSGKKVQRVKTYVHCLRDNPLEKELCSIRCKYVKS